MIKLIAADLDGTILDSRKKIDSRLIEVAEKLRERGIEFTFVSGRNEELMHHYVDEFGLKNPYVTNNGGNIYKQHVCLFNDYIPCEYNNILARMLWENDIAFRLFSEEGFYSFGLTAFFESRMGLFQDLGLKDYKSELDLKDLHIYKITCDFTGYEDKTEAFVKRVRELCPEMNFLKAETNVYCANSFTANKGAALKRVCEMMGIGIHEVMAFGDNGNDLSMLEMSGISVAMGNSEADIKERCDYVCKDNDHNGVSSFLQDFFKL